MRKVLLPLLLSFSIVLSAQDYNIDFTASGASNMLDSVHVINLDQQTELTLLGTDTLHLVKSGIGIETVQSNSVGIKIFPNPLQEGQGTLSFHLGTAGETRIEIFDIEGKKILSKIILLQSGQNDFHFSGMPSGFFTVNVNSNSFSASKKLVSINGQNGIPRLEFVQNTTSKLQKATVKSTKSVKSIRIMQYNAGEQLKFTAYSGSLTTVEFIIPSQSQTVDFYFGSVAAPSAAFSVSDTLIDIGDTIQFTDLSTNSPTSWLWDFGDGNISNLKNSVHVYDTAGVFTVSLTATNNAGSDTETRPDYIIVSDTSLGSYPSGTVHCISGGAAVMDVTNPTTGETWMDRNLGASQQAISSTDSLAYGDLYQWGRFSDGHQCRNSSTTNTNATTATPNNGNSWDGKFIASSSFYNHDWLTAQNNNLWQGVNDTNNPCPNGYRLPIENELNSERQSWSSCNSAGAFYSPLKLPVAGYRDLSNGSLSIVGSSGYYWSSTANGSCASCVYSLNFYNNIAHLNSSNNRANGYSVRCIKDGSVQPPSIKIHPSDKISNNGGNALFSVFATGSSLSYQWQESTDGGTTWNALSIGGVYSSVTTDTMNITSVTLSMDSTQYRCVLSASGLPVDTSNAATLTVISSSGLYPAGTVHCISGGAAVVDVTNPTTGETWMDRNLGASQQATSSTDSLAYGDLYQWGRFSDGHQCRNSSTTSTKATTATPNNGNPWDGKFISSGNYPYDWLNSQNHNLWQGVNGTNNPCPNGYRLPTGNELDIEHYSWSSDNAAGAYVSPLKLPVAGNRYYSSGGVTGGSFGRYISSTVHNASICALSFNSINSNAEVQYNVRSGGYSVRCLKDGSIQQPLIKTHCSDQIINDGGNAFYSVSTTGSSVSYQWYESTDGGTTWNSLSNGGIYSNVTTDTMNITSATLNMDTYKYRCVLSASGLPVDTSNAAALTVKPTSPGSYPFGAVHCISGGATVVDVNNPTTGETWMDRNLGASQQATSSTDSLAYGDLYQWGRFSDGHQCRSSNITNMIAMTATPNNGNSWDGKFITSFSFYNFDWLMTQNHNLWQGVNGTNIPCPNGYRLPTENELNSERQSWSSNNAAGAYSSPLKLPVAGRRYYGDGWLYIVGFSGYYWSSTFNGTASRHLQFSPSSYANLHNSKRAEGRSVRCIKD